MNVPEGARMQRRAVPAPVVGQELALEPRDVNAYRTLGLAGPALQAQVEHLADALVAKPGFVEAAGHHQAQRVRTSSRRVRFFLRRHIRRAHRPVERLAARAEAAAHLDGAVHSAPGRVVEPRLWYTRSIGRAVAEVRDQRRSVDDLSGVENAVRIERPF